MKNRLMTKSFAAFTATLAIAGGITLRADDALPKAETILDHFIEVTGGKAAYENRKSEVVSGTFELPAMGLKAPYSRYSAPDKMYTVIEIEGIGKIEQGVSDGVAWDKSAMQGAHVKSGVEKAQSMREATFNSSLHWRKIYPKVETAGVETVGGEECYKVVMTPVEGKPETNFYSKKTGLLVKSIATIESAMGEMQAEAIAGNYKEFGGIMMPSKMTQKVGPQEVTMTIESVKVNETIPADKFEIPADIKALANKPAAK
jgi:zinc protease